MATTAKSALRYPALSDTANVPRDVGNLAADLDGRVITVCTSGTRPASPGQGQFIYETDTGLTNIYSGTRWRRISDTEIGNQIATSNPTLTMSMTTIATVTVVSLGGTLRVAASAMLNNGNSGADRQASLQLTLDTVAQTPSFANIDLRLISGSSAVAPWAFNWEIAAVAGTHTLALQALASLTSSVTVPVAEIIVIERP